jgi:predicted homoserine dehydrogenase-like protein
MNQMLTLKRRLISLEKEIRVGVIFTDTYNTGLIHQIHKTVGMKPVTIACQNPKAIAEFVQNLDCDHDIVNTLDDLNFTIQRERVAITEKPELITGSRLVNVLVEASSDVYTAALNAMKAIRNHQHVIMMNPAVDMMYGSLLLRMADEEGMIYSCADGSHATALKKIIDDLELWGFNIVMAGCITGSPDRYANPNTVANEARAQGMNLKSFTAHVDNSLLNIEMAVLANGINARTMQPGMTGKTVSKLPDIVQHAALESMWNGKNPIVDYVITNELQGSVFVIGHNPHEADLVIDASLRSGPFSLFYRPFRLGYVEVPSCIAEAYLDYSARLQPMYGMKTNVFTYAKKDLKAGDRLDGLGGYQTFGAVENTTGSDLAAGLPIMLSENLRLKRDIKKDTRIALEDVEYDAEEPAFALYKRAQLYNVVTPQTHHKTFEEIKTNRSDTSFQYV